MSTESRSPKVRPANPGTTGGTEKGGGNTGKGKDKRRSNQVGYQKRVTRSQKRPEAQRSPEGRTENGKRRKGGKRKGKQVREGERQRRGCVVPGTRKGTSEKERQTKAKMDGRFATSREARVGFTGMESKRAGDARRGRAGKKRRNMKGKVGEETTT
jgi:hypothetical protein